MSASSESPRTVLAGYRARGSDLTMIRWITPAVVIGMVLLGFLAGGALALVVFLAGAAVVVVRWVWVTMLGPRPLAIEIALTDGELRIKTMRGTSVVALRGVHSLMPVGFRRRTRGPCSLVTDAGAFTLYPDGVGFDELVGALEGAAPRLRVERPGEPDTTGARLPPSSPTTAASEPEPRPEVSGGDRSDQRQGVQSDLAPGVVVIAVVGSRSLADEAVAKLEAAGVTALALPSASGIGGVRVTVAERDRERAEAVLREGA